MSFRAERTAEGVDVLMPFGLYAHLTLAEARVLVSDLTRALFASVDPAIKGSAKSAQPCPGGRRAFRSENAARAANRSAKFRFRPYRCEGCGRWHVTNVSKGRDASRPRES